MTALLWSALVAGLVGSPHCLAMCGGFVSACAPRPASVAAWHAGRLTTYAALGAIAGALGYALPGPRWLPAVIAVTFLVWFAGSLAGLWPEPRLHIPGLTRAGVALARRDGVAWRYAFGLTTGLLPCGMVYAALALPVAAASAPLGAAAMVCFGLGTVPALTAFAAGAQRLLGGGRSARRLAALLVLVAGLWAVYVRSRTDDGSMPPGTMDHGPPR
jgi:sulfite exporter TauE/SafE